MQIIKEKHIDKTNEAIHTNFNQFNSLLYSDASINDSTKRITLLDIYFMNYQNFTLDELGFDSSMLAWYKYRTLSNWGLVDLGSDTDQNIISFEYRDTALLAFFEKDQSQNLKFVKLQKIYSPFYSSDWETQKYFKLKNGFLSIYFDRKEQIQRALLYNENGVIVDSMSTITSFKRDGNQINLTQNNRILYTINENTLKFEIKYLFDDVIDICEYNKDTILLLNKSGLFKYSKTTNAKYEKIETGTIDMHKDNTWLVTTFYDNILLYKMNSIFYRNELHYRPKN